MHADSISKAGASLASALIHCPHSLSYRQYPLHPVSKMGTSRISLPSQMPSLPVSMEKLVLPRSIRCKFYRLCCHGHSLLLLSYLQRISRKDNSSCRACGHPQLDFNLFLTVLLGTSTQISPWLYTLYF